MDQALEEDVKEVLYEIRQHARGAVFPDSSQDEPQISTGPSGGLLSSLSIPGVSQLKEKWNEYRRPRRFKTRPALFVSRGGKYVAVAAGNQIVMLHKEDDYMEPCGVFTSNDRHTVFSNGAWSESQGILGVIDEMSTLYFIKSNGDEITRRTRSQLKLSSSLLHLIVKDDLNLRTSDSFGFCILTTDGLLYLVEVTQAPSATLRLITTSSNHLKQKREFPRNFSCLDIHQDLSLIVLVGVSSVSVKSGEGTGLYSLSLLRISTSSELELMFCSSNFEGLFSVPKAHTNSLVSPKVAISPKGGYIATLDLTGHLDVFNLDADSYCLSLRTFTEREFSKVSDNRLSEMNGLNDIVDFTWWTDHILMFTKRSGRITMYNVLCGMRVLEKETVFCMPVVERVEDREGYAFVLEVTSLAGGSSMPMHEECSDMQYPEYIPSVRLENTVGMYWSLMSFSESSVSEMYNLLLRDQQYDDALKFADRHGLDKDEIFKAQWLHSEKGIFETNMFLSKVKDQMFVISECVNTVGPTEDAAKHLISYGLRITDQYKFSDSDDGQSRSIWDFRMLRLQLLQFKDRLETFMGINMGRFSTKGYRKFRLVPLTEAAIGLAGSGKIGALNLLFKRHPYSLSSSILEILSAIPETVPVQTYGQLLPGRYPTSTLSLREKDWVECEKMISFINKQPNSNSDNGVCQRTEYILKQCVGFVWPSVTELCEWYKDRARDVDNLSGQLDNSLSLVDFACRKGIDELRQFLEDISYMHQLIYSDECDGDLTMSLVTWEQLSDYEKFRMMLKGVKAERIVGRLQEQAIPFMQSRCSSEVLDTIDCMNEDGHVLHCESRDSFLVRWLKEVATDSKLDICLAVIENTSRDSPTNGLFKNEVEKIETSLQCLYLCTLTDQWNMMASILSKLPRKTVREKYGKDINPRHSTQGFGTPRLSYMKTELLNSDTHTSSISLHEEDSVPFRSLGFDEHLDSVFEKLEKRIKDAEDHVEVGRLLAYYQIPKPMNFFLGAHSDEKNVKQLLRLILSKFCRRQPGRSDNDWANMWRDMQCFQEKAFPFLDIEFMLEEFCRGLLKAGKFSLARNYLKGTGTVALATEKVESLVIQAAREYFFSASSLDCTEIWMAKECLSLFPNSRTVQAEVDIIDALTVRLPNIGVTVLPMEFRQKRNPMEIINMVISSQAGAYLDVEELIEIAKLLGLSSQDDIAVVEEAVAREAAVAGDMQLAFDLCLALVKKGHAAIWDLCSAIAKGPHLDNMETGSRKQLLGFALNHCDEESIGELLHSWKDIDLHSQNEQLMTSTVTCPPNFSIHGLSAIPLPVHSVQDILQLRESSETMFGPLYEGGSEDQVQFENIKKILSKVGKDLPRENGGSWDSLLIENRKALSFSALELPWLLELSVKEEYGKRTFSGTKAPFRKHNISIRMQALISIISWLAGNDIAPTDDLIISLAKSIMESPATEEDDVLGCSFLLNLMNAFLGVEIIEEQLKQREEYQEVYNIMNIGMTYSSLHKSLKECSTAEQRRNLLLCKFHEKHAPFSSDEKDQIDKVQSTFWRDWETKLEEQRQLADQARALEELLPGTETTRFLSGDIEYIKDVVFSFIDSVKVERKHILKEAVKLADTYGLSRIEVLLRFFGCTLLSDQWENDDILAEIQEFREDVVTCAKDVIDMIRSAVYPEIDGHNKKRLSYIYSILSACYLRLRATEPALTVYWYQGHEHIFEPNQFYKLLEQECRKVAFISELNFKNITGLDDLNFEQFNAEICNNIHDSTVDVVADMVQTLVGIYKNSQEIGLMSGQDVYKYHVLHLLASVESGIEASSKITDSDELQATIQEIELSYNVCKKYIKILSEADISCILGEYCSLCVPSNQSGGLQSDPAWQDSVVMLLNFWIKVVDDFQGTVANEASQGELRSDKKCLSRCLKVFKKMVVGAEISATHAWETLFGYNKLGLVCGLTTDITYFLEALIFSGCGYRSIAQVYNEAQSDLSFSSGSKSNFLLDLYASLIDRVLLNLSKGCDEKQNLHNLLSSLSRLDGDDMDFQMIRCEVWQKLSAFSDDMKLESHIRVYALELMQSITGIGSVLVRPVSVVEPWEAWDGFQGTSSGVNSVQTDFSSSITNTLVALKSSRLAATISSDIRINPEDLISTDSAVSCFLRLCRSPSTKANIDVLKSILIEWEELFPTRVDTEEDGESHDEADNWSCDGWDEGWERLSEEPIDRKGKQDVSVQLRPLHACWMEISVKLVGHSESGSVVELLDWSLSKPGILLDEDEVRRLFQLVVESDCLIALKILLLLPYEALWLQCLGVVESKLRNEGFPRCVDDYDLLTVLLSSGVLQIIATNPAFSSLLSYSFYLVGRLARLCQEDMLRFSSDDESWPSQNLSILFSKVLLPCFVSVLVMAEQYFLAGAIVSRWMHTPSSLGLMDVMEASLKSYLEGQVLRIQPLGGASKFAEEDSCGSLVNTISSLRGKMGSSLQSALTALPTTSRQT